MNKTFCIDVHIRALNNIGILHLCDLCLPPYEMQKLTIDIIPTTRLKQLKPKTELVTRACSFTKAAKFSNKQ